MTVEEYVNKLKPLVDPKLVEDIKDWSIDNQMYILLHNIQLDYMSKFMNKITGVSRTVNDPFRAKI